MPDAFEQAVIGDPRGEHVCPSCGKGPLLIEDHSARPIMLWIEVSCRACGFRHMINAPLAGG